MIKRTLTGISTGSVLSRVVGATLIVATSFAAVMMNGAAAGGISGPSISVTTVEQSVSVNRINKGDRVSQTTANHPSHGPPSTEAVIPPKRVPLGCDPAFSPVADPVHGTIYKRCMV
jgi:predicted phage tail protein